MKVLASSVTRSVGCWIATLTGFFSWWNFVLPWLLQWLSSGGTTWASATSGLVILSLVVSSGCQCLHGRCSPVSWIEVNFFRSISKLFLNEKTHWTIIEYYSLCVCICLFYIFDICICLNTRKMSRILLLWTLFHATNTYFCLMQWIWVLVSGIQGSNNMNGAFPLSIPQIFPLCVWFIWGWGRWSLTVPHLYMRKSFLVL